MIANENKQVVVFAAQNPLRSELIERTPIRFESGGWDENLDRLQRLGFRAAVVGRKGSGKTCLLEQLGDQLANRFQLASWFVRMPFERNKHEGWVTKAIEVSKQGSVLLLDGTERLSFWQRQRLMSRTRDGSGLVVAVHRRCRLPTWVHFRTDLQLMRNLLEDLGIATPDVLAAGEDAFRSTRGNVREAFRLLYDQFANGRLAVEFVAANESNT